MPITKASSNAVAPAAKGDLVVGSATNDSGVLAVGANNTVLTADSAEATGLKWATPAGGATLLAQKKSGNYYKALTGGNNVGAGMPYFNTTFYVPVYFQTGTADRLTLRTSSGFSGSPTLRMGIYNNVDGFPTTVLLDAGNVSPTAADTNYTITISQAVTAGWYWLAVKGTDGGGSNDFWSYNFTSTSVVVHGFISSTTSELTYVKQPVAYYQTGVTGAFATAGTLVDLDNYAPIVKVRIS